MSHQFFPFRRVTDVAFLQKLSSFLEENDIPYQTEEENNSTTVLVPVTVFDSLESLMISNNLYFLTEKPDDFYLQGFSNQELLEIIISPEEWGAIDFHLALEILKKRGLTVNKEFLEGLRISK